MKRYPRLARLKPLPIEAEGNVSDFPGHSAFFKLLVSLRLRESLFPAWIQNTDDVMFGIQRFTTSISRCPLLLRNLITLIAIVTVGRDFLYCITIYESVFLLFQGDTPRKSCPATSTKKNTTSANLDSLNNDFVILKSEDPILQIHLNLKPARLHVVSPSVHKLNAV